MQYEVLAVRVGPNMEVYYGTRRLERTVKEKILQGWEPQGGVTCTSVAQDVYIMQAMVLRKESDK